MSDEQIFDNLINVLQKYNFAECSCYDNEIYKGLFRIINEKWITIHPHGDKVDEDGKKDYRRLKLEDGETPREAIERVYKKKDKKENKKQYSKSFQKQVEGKEREYNLAYEKLQDARRKRRDFEDKAYYNRNPLMDYESSLKWYKENHKEEFEQISKNISDAQKFYQDKQKEYEQYRNDVIDEINAVKFKEFDDSSIEAFRKDLRGLFATGNIPYEKRKMLQNKLRDVDKETNKRDVKKKADEIGGYTKKLNDIWGFESMPDIDWMPDDMQKMVCKKSKQIKDKYPKLKLNALQGLNLSKRTYAQYTSTLRQVTLNKQKFDSIENIKSTYEKDVKKNFHPQGTDYESVLTHEIGHALHYYIEEKYNVSPKTIRKNVLDRLKLKQKEVGKHLSDYAMAKPRNAHEFFAEAFAEGFDSKNPRPLAVEFMKEINKILGDVA